MTIIITKLKFNTIDIKNNLKSCFNYVLFKIKETKTIEFGLIINCFISVLDSIFLNSPNIYVYFEKPCLCVKAIVKIDFRGFFKTHLDNSLN